eukprot:CAMPEP_0206213402 /NCGR_PEP_ID=MMETSP0047_2-20121206/1104_1 /ASSEMBLY_ACC=CAM_ASM_000192 /TAXON_ID=195065 /ORGANISM="Chroomonas mesostigmatica_cf, Strain CCMP1168" /LENGTH=101 /DNA_ID=CAMNT_0053635551 /DNA_START=27 /DNA_END=332 /DNA_ORIENTATION=+
MFEDHKSKVPLHYALFRRVAPCITVEANVERLFSHAGRISDPNINASTLSKYAFIARNTQFQPSKEEIKKRYAQKYKSFSPPSQEEDHFTSDDIKDRGGKA